jgi:hypothetical protein
MSEERKWRKKPVVISAVQYRSDSPAEIDGVTTAYKNVYNGTISPIDRREPFEGDWVPIAAIKTMEGWHEVADGDWVITGVSGEKYPCKPKEFALTYEPASMEFQNSHDAVHYLNMAEGLLEIAKAERDITIQALSRTPSDALARYKALEGVAKASAEVKGDIANYCGMCACHDLCAACRVTRFLQALRALEEADKS